jgi:sugar lactone lactonase YvrE
LNLPLEIPFIDRDFRMIRTTLFVCLSLSVVPAALVRAQDVPLSQILIPGEAWKLVGEGYKFTEAPIADAQGNVYFADVPESKIFKIDASGKPALFLENTQATSGLEFGPGGKLYGCQSGGRRIVIYESGGAKTVADDVDCNDLVVTSAGGVYFTDPKNKQVWFVDPQGNKKVVDKGIEFPNGLALWPDQQTLVVADTRGAELFAFRIEKDGSLSFKQGFYPAQLMRGQTGSGADGLAADSLGRIYAATFAGVQMFDTQGRLSGIIAKPQEKFLSNVAFGGPQFDTLYVTCTDKVYLLKTKVTGARIQ